MFAVLYCSPWLGLTITKPLIYRGEPPARCCDFKLPREEYLAYFFADLIVFYLIPLLLSCVLYSLIARVLFARRGRGGGRLKGTGGTAAKTSNGSVTVVVDTAAANSARAQVKSLIINFEMLK
ncbi:hypothetical protein B566_EDAN002591 [Ephemera danica]|nr:hypothetical protein B566_EDAN002591 [Ephemera danica]